MTDTTPNTTDTTPGDVDPSTLDGYEPPVEGETQREKRNRKARNRRRAEKVQAQAQAAAGPAPVGRPSRQGKRAQAVTGIVTGVGIAVYAIDEHDGHVIVEGASDLGDALAKVAEKNAKVAKALDALTETSAWAEVAVALGAIVIPIARHHAPRRQLDEPEPAPGDDPTTRAARTPAPAPEPAPPEATPQTADDVPTFTVRSDVPNADVPTFTARRD